MRLLTAKNLELREFAPNEIPPYAILSHTWDGEEVLFTEIGTQQANTKRGYAKLELACRQALQDGFDYVWVDTCCIDKNSSSELGEAINSMYIWYAQAQVCYVYLADVADNADTSDPKSEFAQSRWFTRGWTLQELLAPDKVIFYAANWVQLGEKTSIVAALSAITRIDEEFLLQAPLHRASIAKKMSWAARRTTTRPEDIAYCLMGIFSVNMPMIYGEGIRAFIRLQEEIIKQSDDETIFTWINPDADPEAMSGLLAESPAFFAQSGSHLPFIQPRKSAPFSMTNQGLSITLGLSNFNDDHIALLNCPDPELESYSLGLMLKQHPATGNYSRIRCDQILRAYPLGFRDHEIRVQQTASVESSKDEFDAWGFDIQGLPSVELGYSLRNLLYMESSLPNQEDWLTKGETTRDRIIPAFSLSREPGTIACALLFDTPTQQRILVTIGSSFRDSIGFSAIAVDNTVTSVGEAWHPRCQNFFPASTELTLDRHKVNLHVQTTLMGRRKHCRVDIDIKAFQYLVAHVSIGAVRPAVENKNEEKNDEPNDELDNQLGDEPVVGTDEGHISGDELDRSSTDVGNATTDDGPKDQDNPTPEDQERVAAEPENIASIDQARREVDTTKSQSEPGRAHSGFENLFNAASEGLQNDVTNSDNEDQYSDSDTEIDSQRVRRRFGVPKRGWSTSIQAIDFGGGIAFSLIQKQRYEWRLPSGKGFDALR